MGMRGRKAVGIVLTLVFLAGYALVAMVVGARLAGNWPEPARLAIHVVAGLLWLPIVMAIVRWMSRPD